MMTLELVKCPHCGYQYHTNMEKIIEDGETVAVRLGFSDVKKLFITGKTIENRR